MSNIRTYHSFLSAVTTTGESNTYVTDYRYSDVPQRTIQGVLTSGAQVNVYTYMHPTSGLGVEHLVSTFDASSFSTVIEGPVARIRVEMVSGGTATVDGLV